MADCRFCRIVDGERGAAVVYEDERSVAFLDVAPATLGHTLVVPKHHEQDLLLAPAPDAVAVMRTARTVATAIEAELEPDGFSLFHTTGELVGTVEHAHLHVVPRYVGDEIHISLDQSADASENPDRLAARLRDRI